ncbi:MAG: hypothetical protein QF437_15775 [Planctomycetota bacterium]|jgi:hypothetical protein|nr:hypothetical protein [Planctomycetota bacterium]MDP7131956.1 hypothetical protein [Planctomycetota bacterium]MDP7252412.1 hypothetical protein [Planctomycetota bacterium]
MSKRKKRAAPKAGSKFHEWLQSHQEGMTEEDREALWFKSRLESHTLLNSIEVEVDEREYNRIKDDFVTELDWYQEYLNGEDEKKKWWFCHQIRQNMLNALFGPRFKTQFVMELERLAEEACEEDNVEAAMVISSTIAFLYTTDAPVEIWSLCRAYFSAWIEATEPVKDASDDIRKAYEVYREYDSMSPDEDPFLKWVTSEAKVDVDSPIPFEVEEEKLQLLTELSEAIERGLVPIQILNTDQIQELYQKSEMYILPLIQQQGEIFADFSHSIQHRFGRFSREFLAGLRESDRWETIRTSIAVAHSNSKMAAREDIRKWVEHLGVTLETLEAYDRGNHPVLRSIVVQEIHRFHQEQRQRMQQQGRPGMQQPGMQQGR